MGAGRAADWATTGAPKSGAEGSSFAGADRLAWAEERIFSSLSSELRLSHEWFSPRSSYTSSRVLRTRYVIARSIGHVDSDGRFTTHAT